MCRVVELPVYRVHNEYESGFPVAEFRSNERVRNAVTRNYTYVKRGEGSHTHMLTCSDTQPYTHTFSIDTHPHKIMQYTHTYTLALQHKYIYNAYAVSYTHLTLPTIYSV